MAAIKKKTSKFIVRKSKKTGQKIKLYGGPMAKVLAAEKARKRKRNSTSNAKSAGKGRARKRNSAVKIIVRKNGKRIYGAAAKAVLAKRNAAKRNRKPGKIEQLLSVAGGDRVARAYDIVANPKDVRRSYPVYELIRSGGKLTKRHLGDVIAFNRKDAIVKARISTAAQGKRIVVGQKKNPTSKRNPYLAIINPKKGKAKKRNLDHRDAAHPIEVSHYWQGRKGYKTQWQRAHEGGQQQLFRMNPKRRKRNGLYEEFHGEEARSMSNDLAPDGTPANVEMLGRLDVIYFQKGDEHIPKNGKTHSCIEFGKDGEERPKLVSNANGTRYYIVGNITQFTPASSLFGKATRIEYTARKPHLEGHDKPVPYWHPLGEENGIRPTLETDHEGYLVLKGGDYRTTDAGIIN